MKPWQGVAHAAVVCTSVWLCRFTIFEALQWWTGLVPSDGLLLGSLVLSMGLASAPIVTQHFSHLQVLFPSALGVQGMGFHCNDSCELACLQSYSSKIRILTETFC